MNDMPKYSTEQLFDLARKETSAYNGADYAFKALNSVFNENPINREKACDAIGLMIEKTSQSQDPDFRWKTLTEAYSFADYIEAENLQRKATEQLIKTIPKFCEKNHPGTRKSHIDDIYSSYIHPEWQEEAKMLLDAELNLLS